MLENNQKVLPELVVRECLKNLGGQFVTITAIKKDGAITVINGQLVESPPSHNGHSNLVSLRKMGQGYRTANYKRITRIAFAGHVLATAS